MLLLIRVASRKGRYLCRSSIHGTMDKEKWGHADYGRPPAQGKVEDVMARLLLNGCGHLPHGGDALEVDAEINIAHRQCHGGTDHFIAEESQYHGKSQVSRRHTDITPCRHIIAFTPRIIFETKSQAVMESVGTLCAPVPRQRNDDDESR
ncbi:hypothetical protein K438DRAFT_1775346 [Mycena galopus ATCC 62051]|nr:hypothetical protein K438DRAFT_1775346 [Mycena galopus ATCC 62051]